MATTRGIQLSPPGSIVPTLGLSIALCLLIGFGVYKLAVVQHEQVQEATQTHIVNFSRALATITNDNMQEGSIYKLQQVLLQGNFYSHKLVSLDVLDLDRMVVASKKSDRIGMEIEDLQWVKAHDAGKESVNVAQGKDGTRTLVITEPLKSSSEFLGSIRMVYSFPDNQQSILEQSAEVMWPFLLGMVVMMWIGLIWVNSRAGKVIEELKEMYMKEKKMNAGDKGKKSYDQITAGLS